MKGRRKLTYSFTEILNRRLNLQVGQRVLISVWVAADSAQTLADAAYSIKHNLQVCQPNASPSYPCTMGTAKHCTAHFWVCEPWFAEQLTLTQGEKKWLP